MDCSKEKKDQNGRVYKNSGIIQQQQGEINDFKKQVHIIRADSIVYYNSIYKIYNWLYWCYWNPNSPFRKKKLSKEYDAFTGV